MSEEPNAAAVGTSALPIAPGQIIAERYRVGEVLGGGGMGMVCAGTHVLLGTPVAIKLIHPELKDDHEAVQRFVHEARATAALKGEHIARVFDVGLLPSGEPFLVMEQLEGVSLDHYLQSRGALPRAEAIAIALQVCEGLAEAHAAALVHRDIKPGNLFLARRPDGSACVKILDFGIAKQRLRPDALALTNPGRSLGSPWYMSPEQMLTPANVDERADVWSIGVLLFELLTGRVPFDGENVPQVCANVLGSAPPRPSELCADVSAELEQLILRCLEKDPEHRFRSVTELGGALLPFASAEAAFTAPEPVPREAPSSPDYDSLSPLHTTSFAPAPSRHSVAWPLAMAAVAMISLLFGGWLEYRTLAPQLAAATADVALERAQEQVLLQSLHGARAVPEPESLDETAPTTRPRASFVPRRAPARSLPSSDKPRAASSTWQSVTEERYGL